MKYRPIQNIVTEAIVIGVLNFIIYMILKRYTNLSVNMKLLLSGALIHILFEFSGANELWCRTTYE